MVRVPRDIPHPDNPPPPEEAPEPAGFSWGKLATFLGWVLGWLGVVWTVAEITSPWIWPAGIGILVIALAGIRPLIVVVTFGIWSLDRESRRDR